MSQPQLQPTWDLKRKKTAQADDLEKQKEMMEKQLRDRAQRLSRLSSRLTQSGKNNLTAKLKAFEAEQLSQQLEELQNAMRQEERERKEAEMRERKRAQEEAELRRRTETMERAYKDLDPTAIDPAVSLRAQRRRTAMQSIRGTAGWSEEELKKMEQQAELEEQSTYFLCTIISFYTIFIQHNLCGTNRDDASCIAANTAHSLYLMYKKAFLFHPSSLIATHLSSEELKERELQRMMTEKKLKEIEEQIKKKERAKEEERLRAQQRQLAFLEKKLKELEEAADKVCYPHMLLLLLFFPPPLPSIQKW
jgi:hypothetical protein